MDTLLNSFFEIKADFTDDENLTYVDGYRTEDENEEGKTLAVICRDTSKVIYMDGIYRQHPQVQEAIQGVLEDIKVEHMAAGLQEGESAVLTVNGQFLVFPSAEKNPNGCDYVRFINNEGEELVYWNCDEWQENPELVMGAIMACIQNGAEKK